MGKSIGYLLTDLLVFGAVRFEPLVLPYDFSNFVVFIVTTGRHSSAQLLLNFYEKRN